MSNPLADLTQAPLLYCIGDKTYEVSPLTQNDLGHFCRFVQFADYYTLKDLPDIPPEVVSTSLDKCLRKTVTMGDEAFNSVAQSPQGLAEFAYLSLRHKHATLSRADLASWSIKDVGNVSALAAMLSSPNEDESQQKKTIDLILHLKEQKLLLS